MGERLLTSTAESQYRSAIRFSLSASLVTIFQSRSDRHICYFDILFCYYSEYPRHSSGQLDPFMDSGFRAGARSHSAWKCDASSPRLVVHRPFETLLCLLRLDSNLGRGLGHVFLFLLVPISWHVKGGMACGTGGLVRAI